LILGVVKNREKKNKKARKEKKKKQQIRPKNLARNITQRQKPNET
jgi:hypothetical protein